MPKETIVPVVVQRRHIGIGDFRFIALTTCVLLAGLGCKKRSRMTLISNQENTLFEMRHPGEGNWTRIGKGKIVYTEMRKNEPCEIRAKPSGYVSKAHILSGPVQELRFTFEISDRVGASKIRFLELDARLVEVTTARTLSSAHRRTSGTQDLRDSVEHCSRELLKDSNVSGTTVAVLPFVQTGVTTATRHALTASNMMITAMQKHGGCELIERSQLDQVLQEHDLSLAEVTNDPKLLGQVLGVQYVVLGSVSVM